ncbi:MAG: DUF488 domain-containing protein [Xanthomonadales bacterium]|nr:DUF488 domain-containing protein [Xanthomonadales bacterium]
MKIFTIGFTKTSAEHFFSRLKRSGATKIIDVRLNNVSQLAGFAKRDDLRYFASAICGMHYEHLPVLAPTQSMLDGFKKKGGAWDSYAEQFTALMRERRIETLDPARLDGACLLCSEDKPHACHRRLVAEYLSEQWQSVKIVHL